MRNENIKQVNELIKEGKIESFIQSSNKFALEIKSIKSVLEEKLKNLELKRVEEEKQKVEAQVVETVVQPEVKEEKVKEEKAEEKPAPKQEVQKEVKPQEEKKEEVAVPEEKVEVKEEKPAEFTPPALPSFILRREGPIQKPAKPERKGDGAKPRNEFRPNSSFERQPRQDGAKGQGQNNFNRGPKPDFNKGDRQGAPNKKPQNTFVAPPIIQKEDKRSFAKKKQNGERSFEEKRVINKRALIKGQVDIDDFDENKTGYRKMRPAKKTKEKSEVNVIKIEKAVINTEIIPLKVLSEKIGITAAEITKRLFKEGIMKTINDSIDFDTAAFIADDIGVELELKLDKTAEDVLSEGFDDMADASESLKKRPPVVTVMGHVDHGKTSILDRIRKTNVTAGEAGGITQHIGAYQVTVGGEAITFLDTPGHAAFTAMRARGAQATDIAVLVVAADDGIMPQTIEAINHAKAADVPIIVAINKIDKPEANIERIKTQLTDHGLLPEEWGGDTILCPVSAKTGEGFDNLLENINLVAEIKDLKANPDRKAKGVVIEAKLDQSKGPIATILVQNGTLKVSDSVIVGTVTGKIRAMVDDKGRRVTSAGPSTPVSIMG